MTERLQEVTSSYYRCRRSDQFVDTFYALFLSKSPRVADKFANTNFKVQKLMLRESLLEMLCFARGMTGTYEQIQKLGKRHRELDVTPEMYVMWLDSLCETIQRHDPEYSPELELLWREAMQEGIDIMIAASTE
jgi:hemoglobin-like flavoprotein